MPSLTDVRNGRERIGDAVALTPLVSAAGLEVELTAALHIKLESLQRTGAFKDRGAPSA